MEMIPRRSILSNLQYQDETKTRPRRSKKRHETVSRLRRSRLRLDPWYYSLLFAMRSRRTLYSLVGLCIICDIVTKLTKLQLC